MILRFGEGLSFMSDGVMKMPSASARFGSLNTSTTSMECRLGRCTWQSVFRLAIASAEFCASPATYSRNLNIARRLMAGSLCSGAGLHLRPAVLSSVCGPATNRPRDLPWFSAAVAFRPALQRFPPHLEFRLLGVELDALELPGDVGELAGVALGALLFPAQGAHQDLAPGTIGVGQRYPCFAQDQ